MLARVILSLSSLTAYAADPAPPAPPENPAATLQISNPVATPYACILQATRFLYPQLMVMMLPKLNLNDEQKKKFDDLVIKSAESLRNKVLAQREASRYFVIAMADGTKSIDEMTKLAEISYQSEKDIIVDRLKTLEELRSFLTNEQKEELKADMRSRFYHWQKPVIEPQPPRNWTSLPTVTPEQKSQDSEKK